MKIGLFGGSFNPVHNTHMDVAFGVVKRLGLDLVLFVPAGNPYHKERGTMLPAELRFEMLHKAIDGFEELGVSDIDMVADGPTYTVHTLTEAAKRYPNDELFFIMGQDAFNSFVGWKDWEQIPLLANIIAVSRPKTDDGDMRSLLGAIFEGIENISENEWKIKGGKSIYIIDDFDFRISSTFVRETWEAGKDITPHVPAAAASFIKEHNDELKKYWL
ncbi:MAG: nicotinate (nicotinamide) nucleotide adenylyltransferase [Desulfovibrio sp. S3730MH75]|nr:MAG: nicotinate (nicotinamide) nucleotide adenylyltransferase [Desulfovibrio sp. S3730MH75]